MRKNRLRKRSAVAESRRREEDKPLVVVPPVGMLTSETVLRGGGRVISLVRGKTRY